MFMIFWSWSTITILSFSSIFIYYFMQLIVCPNIFIVWVSMKQFDYLNFPFMNSFVYLPKMFTTVHVFFSYIFYAFSFSGTALYKEYFQISESFLDLSFCFNSISIVSTCLIISYVFPLGTKLFALRPNFQSEKPNF